MLNGKVQIMQWFRQAGLNHQNRGMIRNELMQRYYGLTEELLG